MKINNKKKKEYKEMLTKSLTMISDENLKTTCEGWTPELTKENISEIFIEKNWEFSCVENDEITFNCIPFDDQLRLYVYIKEKKISEVTLSQE